MKFHEFKDWLLVTLLGALGTYVCWQMNNLTDSVIELNNKIGVALAAQSYQMEKLTDHEERIRDLEKGK